MPEKEPVRIAKPFWSSPLIDIYHGDTAKVMRSLDPSIEFDGVVTSPPYYGKFNYEVEGQIGLEPTLDEYVRVMVDIFRPIRDRLIEGGAMFIVIGDTSNNLSPIRSKSQRKGAAGEWHSRRTLEEGFYEKEPLRVPNALIEGLRADDWKHRETLVWDKMTSSTPAKSDAAPECHESILHMVKWSKGGRMYGNTSPFKSSVLRHRSVGHKVHGCTFPESLAAELLSVFPSNSRILDPFIGTGTTARMGLEVGFHTTGIDLDLVSCQSIKDWRESQPGQYSLYEVLGVMEEGAIA